MLREFVRCLEQAWQICSSLQRLGRLATTRAGKFDSNNMRFIYSCFACIEEIVCIDVKDTNYGQFLLNMALKT